MSPTKTCATEQQRQKAEIDAAANRIMRNLMDNWIEMKEEFDRIDAEEKQRERV